jgi:hypothetical protein
MTPDHDPDGMLRYLQSLLIPSLPAPPIWKVILGFFDDHNGLITAIATVFIAAYTIVLARVSRMQAGFIAAQVRLAREEFITTHRPKIIVRAFQMMNPDFGAGDRPRFIFIAQNIGDTQARITEVRSATLVLQNNERIPNDLAFPHHEPFNVVLRSGQKEVFPGNGGVPLVGEEHMQVFADTHMLLCLGTLTYVDDLGTERETGFCRRYRNQSRQWEGLSSEYEYSY